MKKALLGFLVFLLMGSGTANYLQYEATGESNALIAARETQIRSLRESLENRRAQVHELEKNVVELSVQRNQLQEELSTRDQELEELTSEAEFLRESRRRFQQKASGAFCATSRSFDFSSNTSVHRDLRELTSQYGHPVGGGGWTLIWNNRDAAYHDIRVRDDDGNTYAWKYVVFFDEDRFSDSIFDVNYRCWMEHEDIAD